LSSPTISAPITARPSAPRSKHAAPASCRCPAYSPDFNPIEEAFSKVKRSLRRAQARTDDLRTATWDAFATITPNDAAGWLPTAAIRPVIDPHEIRCMERSEYYENLGKRAVDAVEVGRPWEDVAARFEVSVPMIERWARSSV
jgi:hypothetical protein